MAKNRCLGIDLGTSNCALALSTAEQADILDITQVLGPNRIGEKRTFASAVFFPAPGRFPAGSLATPWSGREATFVAGGFAREIGALEPDRLAASAKSWL